MSQCRGSRCGAGPESHRERVSRAKLARVLDYLPACLSFFVLFLLSSVLFLSPFASLSRFRIGLSRVLLSFSRTFLSVSLHDLPPLRTILRLSCVHSFPSSSVRTLRFLSFYSSLIAFLLSLFNSFSLFSSHPTVRSSLVPLPMCTRLLPTCLTT